MKQNEKHWAYTVYISFRASELDQAKYPENQEDIGICNYRMYSNISPPDHSRDAAHNGWRLQSSKQYPRHYFPDFHPKTLFYLALDSG